MYRLPTSIEFAEGHFFHIRNDGDFRVVLECLSCLEDGDMPESERILAALCIFYDFDDVAELSQLPDLQQAVQKMYWFFDADMPQPLSTRRYRLMSWNTDSALVCSAINKVAGREVRSDTYLHWWTFMGYYMAIGESAFSTVVSIRSKTLRGQKLEKWEREFKAENPEYFRWEHRSQEQLEDEAWLRSVWDKG